MASVLLTREPPGHTLQTTALLNEALRRLLEDDTLREASDRRFLFATIHMAMRRLSWWTTPGGESRPSVAELISGSRLTTSSIGFRPDGT